MAVRITKTISSQETVLQVDGQLRSEDVDDLSRESRSVQGPLVLELSNLMSADPGGVDTLVQLISLGADIRGASPYIDLLLKRGAPARVKPERA